MAISRDAHDIARDDAVRLAGTVRPMSSSGYLLTRIGAESRRRWARMLAGYGLTPHHYGVLIALRQLMTSHQQRLAEAIGVDPRNAVPVIDLLERRGLIARTTDPADRRRRVIELTEAGLRITEELRRAGEAIEAAMLHGLTARQRSTLNTLLHKLYEDAVVR
jgi:DNA-binding MarR family transcriptional regulator